MYHRYVELESNCHSTAILLKNIGPYHNLFTERSPDSYPFALPVDIDETPEN